ncbi:hypothetical protein, partial [Proteus faecis]|uniref:hypothetical protein n=1 Tax=Proteus faecis TaxID=2050967 RepID=UPI003075BA1A
STRTPRPRVSTPKGITFYTHYHAFIPNGVDRSILPKDHVYHVDGKGNQCSDVLLAASRIITFS